MKSHTVKSNAKRAARKLCEGYSIFEPAEPVAAPDGTWWPSVSIIGDDGDAMPAELAEVGKQAVITRPEGKRGASVETDSSQPHDDLEAIAKMQSLRRVPKPGKGGVYVHPELVSLPALLASDRPAPSLIDEISPAIDRVLATLPPPKVSTREEILARREERRQRNAAKAEAEAAAAQAEAAKPPSKAQIVEDMLRRPNGATTEEIMAATGWQSHSVRRFMSVGNSARHLGIVSKREGKVSRYQIPA